MRLRILLIVLLILVIVAGLVWWRWGKFVFLEAKRQKAIELMTKGHISLEQMPKPLGNPQAKVVAEFVAPPFACHNPELLKIAQDIAQKYGDKVYVKFTASPPPGAVTCLGVVINGKQKFQIGNRTIELHGPLAPQGAKTEFGYTREDIEAVIKQEIEKAYSSKK
ncbi:hypothetical protein H5T87_11085 [bacterium]|nr:hypothetical protein [bacterium]